MTEKKVTNEVKEKLPLAYKGRLLAKKDNVIYYGNPEDKYLVMLNITDTGEKDGVLTTTGVTVSLQTNLGGLKEKVIKKVERDGIYKALDIAEYWLNDALNEE
jgi:hypothetical protein